MKLLHLIKTFARNENGAMTVDWVVLTAAIVGLGIAVVSTIGGGVGDVGTAVAGAPDAAGTPTLPVAGQ